jgi:CRP-like cAMP-binding protein
MNDPAGDFPESPAASCRYDDRVTRPSPEILARLPAFRRVSPPDRLRIAGMSTIEAYADGQTIFDEGDPASSFINVISGRVKVFKRMSGGRSVILHLMTEGHPLGAVAAYEGIPYPASAVALDATTCLIIPRQEFFTLLQESPSLMRGVLSGLTGRMIELTDRLADLTGAHVETRFARVFLKLADQLGRPERGGELIPLVLSRQELADMTGTTIETCIRIMSRWGKDDVLRTEKDGFVLVNRQALLALAAS